MIKLIPQATAQFKICTFIILLGIDRGLTVDLFICRKQKAQAAALLLYNRQMKNGIVQTEGQLNIPAGCGTYQQLADL